MIFNKNEDKKIGLKNVPESIDFKFFDKLNKQNNSIIIEINEMRKEMVKFRRITKVRLIFKTSIFVFVATSILAAYYDYEDIIINTIRSIFPG